MHFNLALDLIRNALISKDEPAIWADLGCGTGLFTYALANLLGRGSRIYAVDKTDVKLITHANPQAVECIKIQADFLRNELSLPPLDGIMMANALHYVSDKETFTGKLEKLLKPEGKFIIIEYDTDKPNPWVPYPISFPSAQDFFHHAGFSSVVKLNEIPSVYGRAKIYAAEVSR